MTKTIRTLIVDDEPLAIEGLELRLKHFDRIEVVGTSQSGEDALEQIHKLKPDLVFQDLQMLGINGLEVAQALNTECPPLFIYVTAYSEYAVDAFAIEAVDYILKPVSLGRLGEAISRVEKRLNDPGIESTKLQDKLLFALESASGVDREQLEEWLYSDDEFPTIYPEKISIKDGKGVTIFLPVEDIEWVDAAGDYMCVHASGETHIVRITLKKLQQLLNPKTFMRIHKSTIVNTTLIAEVHSLKNSEATVVLQNDKELRVSRNYSASLQNLKRTEPA